MILPQMLTRQPQFSCQINRSNFFGRNLRHCLLPSLGLTDLISKERWLTWGTAPTSGVYQQGRVVDASANFGGLILNPAQTVATAAQTHLFVTSTDNFSGIYSGLLTVAIGDGSAASFAFQDTSNLNCGIWTDNSTPPDLPFPSRTIRPIGVLIITGDSTGSAAYWNGIELGTKGAGPTTFSNSRIVLYGERLASASYCLKGKTPLYAYAPVKIGAAQAKSLSANPWQIFAPPPQRIWSLPSISGISGNLIYTNINDVLAGLGTSTILGTLSRTNVSDVLSSAGTTQILGTFSRTNLNDTLNAAGSIGAAVSGTFSRTNNNDVLAGIGTTQVLGTFTRNAFSDVLTATGTITVTGMLSRTNTSDVMNASGFTGAPPEVSTRLALTNVGK